MSPVTVINLSVIRLTLRLFSVGCVTVLWLSLTISAFASDWTEKYLHRPEDNLDLHPTIGVTDGSTRQLINLNGMWQAQRRGDKTWTRVLVPGAYDFQGNVEFKRRFLLDSSLVGQSLKLVAFGINNRSTIFVNNEFLGEHSGGHTSFTMELDKQLLTFGAQNEIRILMDNKLLPRNSLPLKYSPRTARNYGGIFRDIFILVVPPISIENLHVRERFSEDFKRCQLQIKTLLKNREYNSQKSENDKKGINFFVELWDVERNQAVAKTRSEKISFESGLLQKEITLTVDDVKLWSPASPYLYECRAYLSQNNEILDEFSQRIGFKEIKLDGKNFKLNGQDLTLLGIDWYEDFPNLGATAGWDTIKEEILRIKNMGANAIRIVATPPHPYVMDISDELGLLVFQEAPLSLIPEARFEDKSFTELAVRYYEEMVERDSHHASLAGWGLGSDLQLQGINTQMFLQRLKGVIQERSSGLTYVVQRYSQESTWPTGADFLFIEFFNKEPDEILSLASNWISTYPDKGFLFSFGYPLIKWGAGTRFSSLRGEQRNLSKSLVPMSIEFAQHQAYKLQQALSQLDEIAKPTGIFIYTYADWQESQPNLMFGTDESALINRSGVVDMNREKRLAYDVVQSAFKAKPPPEIIHRKPPVQNPITYPVAGLALILTFLFNFNRSRRLRGNIRRIFLYQHGFYTELRENRKISGWYTFLVSFLTSAVWGIILSSIAFKFRQDLIFGEILNLVIGNEFLKQKLIWLIWNPPWFIITITGLLYVIFFFGVLVLRITYFILGKSLPISQFFTMVFWASANFLWLLPVTPVYFRIISRPNWTLPALFLLVLFGAWFFVRMFRAIKVVYSLSYLKAGFLILILFVVLFGAVGWYYDRNFALFDYLPVYWNVIKNSVL